MLIAILEDETTQQKLYELWFGSEGLDCQCYGTVSSFIEALQQQKFDVLLIDWVLPDGCGDKALHWVRENLGWDIPVIFISSCDDEVNIVTALRAGADDYIVKPAKYHELLARIYAHSRRIKLSSNVQYGCYQIDLERRTILLNGQTIELTQKEFELASYLFEHPGKLLSRVHLLEKLWGLNADVDTRTVDTHLSRVRRKLLLNGESGWQIFPVYGWGYRMEQMVME